MLTEKWSRTNDRQTGSSFQLMLASQSTFPAGIPLKILGDSALSQLVDNSTFRIPGAVRTLVYGVVLEAILSSLRVMRIIG